MVKTNGKDFPASPNASSTFILLTSNCPTVCDVRNRSPKGPNARNIGVISLQLGFPFYRLTLPAFWWHIFACCCLDIAHFWWFFCCCSFLMVNGKYVMYRFSIVWKIFSFVDTRVNRAFSPWTQVHLWCVSVFVWWWDCERCCRNMNGGGAASASRGSNNNTGFPALDLSSSFFANSKWKNQQKWQIIRCQSGALDTL